MRSHRFINSLLYLIIQLVAKESRANENNGGIRCLFVLSIDKRYVSQVIHLNLQSFRSTINGWEVYQSGVPKKCKLLSSYCEGAFNREKCLFLVYRIDEIST